MPGDEGPIAAEYHAVGAHVIEQKSQSRLAVSYAVVVKTALIGARRPLNILASLGADPPAVVEAPHAEAGRAAAVSDADLEIGTGVENSSEDEQIGRASCRERV